MEQLTPRQRACRAQGLCEWMVENGPRKGESCRERAKWLRRRDSRIFAGVRVCGKHARAFTPDSLVLIGTPDWAAA